MKKIFTFCTVMLLSFTVLFAQQSKQEFLKKEITLQSRLFKAAKASHSGAKISGNPVWQDTMSYCGNAAFSSSIGVNDNTTPVYWAIKIEAAALVGRNNITDVDFYVYQAGAYTLSIAYGSTAPGTAVLTQSITATTSDEGTWKNVHLTTPLSITQNQDMWIILLNSDATFPAAGVTGNNYDNGKYISLDGSSWDLSTDYELNYTWMIRAISDTYTAQAPSVNISGPTTVLAGDTITYTAVSGNADSYAWTINGADYQSTNANIANIMWNTTGTKQVIVAATNTVGTTYDTLDVNVIDCSGITSFPWLEDFEGATQCWQLVDNNNNDNNWEIGNVGSYAYSGENALFNRYSSVQEDNWAISPAITVPSNASDFTLSWYVRARSTAYPEDYGVYISDNGTAIANFDSIFGETYGQTEYIKRSVSLADYAGQTINIAFHYTSNDMFYIYIDNVRVGGPELPENVAINGPIETPANVAATFTASASTPNLSYAWTIENGTPSTATGETVSVTWSTPGNYNVILAATNSVGTVYDTLSVEVFNCGTVTELPYTIHFDSVQSLRCWTPIDANNDGFTWSIYPGVAAVNYSYDMDNEEAIEPDDYLVSPAITLPANGNFELYFSLFAGDQSYYAEHYSVYVSTGNTAADFTTPLFSETLSSSNDVEHTISLNNFLGQTIYIAFRHHDCEDMFILALTNVEVRGMSAPEVSISAPATAIAGNTVTLTAVGDNIDNYAWTIDGATPATATTQSVDVVWNNAGTYTISLTASNSVGSSTATATINVVSCDPISTFPYSEDFEDGDYTCWSIFDADGDGMNWLPGFAFSQPQGHNGSNGMLVSHSYYSGAALTPDNWIYTPAIQVPADGQLYFSWWEKGQDPDYAAEHYAVYVVNQPTTTATGAAFEGTATGNWVNRSISLSNYAGQTVYIGFRHFNVTDMFMLDIDDILISTTPVGINEVNANSVRVYPNPTTDIIYVEGDGISNVEVLDVNGRIVKSMATAGSIDMSELTNGVYMVRTTSDNGIIVRKIVKK